MGPLLQRSRRADDVAERNFPKNRPRSVAIPFMRFAGEVSGEFRQRM
jgi:hypothetical protein